MRKLRYMLYSGKIGTDLKLTVPGLYQWTTAFRENGLKGDMSARIDGDMWREYDIVHVNYTPTNPSYISAIRNELGDDSDTKIIANVDFATMMWGVIDPHIMKDQLNKADMVFHVESSGAKRLENLLKRKVHVIPHPVDVESVRRMYKQDRSPLITCQYHRYNDTWCEYYYGLRNIQEEYGLSIVLMNFSPPQKREGISNVPIVGLFNEIKETMEYHQYIKFMSSAILNVDVTYDNTYGRGIVDMAALGVPTAGSETIEAARILFPTMVIKPGNDEAMESVIKRALDNEEFRDHALMAAMERCDMYSLKNSYEKMVGILEEEELVK